MVPGLPDHGPEPEQAQREGPLRVRVIGARCASGSRPARRKMDRIRAVAYWRYGPVFPVKESMRS